MDLSKWSEQAVDRREFASAALLALLGSVSVTVLGCSSSSYSDPGTGSPTTPTAPNPGDRVGAVSANHGHAALITNAQLNSMGDVTLDIRSTADHTHNVVVTMAELGRIAASERVIKTTSTSTSPSVGTHSHQVVFN
jgi:hypothetical protein